MRDVFKKIAELEATLAALKAQFSDYVPQAIRTVKVGDLEWQADVPDEEFTWEEAKAYAASLGDGWRLPTIKELLTLVDYEKVNPACSVFPDCPADRFWSSSAYAGYPTLAWGVNFDDGYTNAIVVGDANRVRCVRSVGGDR